MEHKNKLAKLTEILYINMYGEGSRDNDVINIGEFNPNCLDSKICIRIANSVAALFNYKIKLGCSFFHYINFLIHEKKLFRNNRYVWDRKNSGRPAHKWLSDISEANEENFEIWSDVWEYLNNNE